MSPNKEERVELPAVTDALVSDAASHLVKMSPLGYGGVSDGILIDVRIVLEWAKETYERCLQPDSEIEEAYREVERWHD